MKAIQIMMDPDLLARLDASEEVKGAGRSSVIREAVEAWLRRRQEAEIVAEYARAYADSGGLDGEWEGWEDQGSWPNE